MRCVTIKKVLRYQGFWGKKLMEAILMRAGSFMAVIILGYVLKKVGFFKEDDFYVMSKLW